MEFLDLEALSESHSFMSDSRRPMDYIVHGILQARILEYWPFPSPGLEAIGL